MNRELLMLVDAISREKSVERDDVFAAVEAALASATKKLHGGEVQVKSELGKGSEFIVRLPASHERGRQSA